jgi:hypothetical protein
MHGLGCHRTNFKSKLIKFERTVDAATYIAALEESGIFDQLQNLFPDGFIYQQDGARPHTASNTMEYLRNRISTDRLLPRDCNWPACSPDLSPIEEVWGHLKAQLDISGIKTKDQLFDAVENLWMALPMQMINNLMDSLKPRILVLEDLQGRSLAGHKDMVRCYQHQGLNGRRHALELKDRHSVPDNWVGQSTTLLENLLDKCRQAGSFAEKNALIGDFKSETQELNRSLPC